MSIRFSTILDWHIMLCVHSHFFSSSSMMHAWYSFSLKPLPPCPYQLPYEVMQVCRIQFFPVIHTYLSSLRWSFLVLLTVVCERWAKQVVCQEHCDKKKINQFDKGFCSTEGLKAYLALEIESEIMQTYQKDSGDSNGINNLTQERGVTSIVHYNP